MFMLDTLFMQKAITANEHINIQFTNMQDSNNLYTYNVIESYLLCSLKSINGRGALYINL